jgi:2-deoxy-D-gluconate 3-dehydrogenase
MHATELFNIKGKKAIVTGGTRGLGHGMAEALLEAGCETVIIGSSEKVFEAAGGFAKQGLNCYAVKADLGKRQEVFSGFNEALQKLGGDLDILITAHGIQRRHSAEVFPLEEWDEVINVNLNSVFILCKEAAAIMLKKGYGKIITISSMVAWFGGQTVPAYTAAKGGVAQLTKELSNDWIARGINVNSIAPGYMATEMNAALLDQSKPRYRQITDRIPAGRWGTPDDMKGAVIFLASHASDYLGGCVLPVDGGYLVK